MITSSIDPVIFHIGAFGLTWLQLVAMIAFAAGIILNFFLPSMSEFERSREHVY